MVLSLGQKTVLRLLNPYIYILNHIIRQQAIVKIISNENIILSEVSLAQKTKNRMFSLICRH
jgi:hypothetical protein